MKKIKFFVMVSLFLVAGFLLLTANTKAASIYNYDFSKSYTSKDGLYVGFKSADGNNICLSHYNGYALENNTKLTIPSVVDGMNVTGLGFEEVKDMSNLIGSSNQYHDNKGLFSNFFENGVEVKEIVVPDTVTAIGFGAFNHVSTLEKITLSKNLQEIGSYAFYECKSLKEIEIPDRVISLGNSVFMHCTSMTKVTLSKGIENISDKAFSHCYQLNDINLVEGLKTIGEGAFAGCKFTSLSFPTTLTNIKNNAFYKNINLKSVDFSEGNAYIGDFAFSSCRALTSAAISSTITNIGTGSFAGCVNLNNIEISPNNKAYKVKYNAIYSIDEKTLVSYPTAKDTVAIDPAVTTIGNGALAMSDVSKVMIQGTVKTIGDYAFYRCRYLTSVTLQNGIEVLGNYSFKDTCCSSILIPGSIKKIGDYSFESTLYSNISDDVQPVAEDNPSDLSLPKPYPLPHILEVTLSEGLTEIGVGSFSGRNIHEIKFPNSLEIIGDSAFENNSLDEINFNKVKKIGAAAFNESQNNKRRRQALPLVMKDKSLTPSQPK